MDTSINSPLNKAAEIIKVVWYSSDALLEQGEAVCYNFDYGTDATASEKSRYNRVETPTTLNAQHFAGVASCKYAAKSGGQLIRICVPGSICNIRLGTANSTVLGVGLLTFDVTATFKGQFRYEGLVGEGSAVPLQTITSDGSTAMCLAKLQLGPPSGGVEVVPLVDNDAIGTLMIGGTTLVTGSVIGGGDCTYILADGTINGLLKKFKIITAEVATSDLVITVTSGSANDLADTSLDTVTFGDAETTLLSEVTLEWGGAWAVRTKTEDVPLLAGT